MSADSHIEMIDIAEADRIGCIGGPDLKKSFLKRI